MKLQLLTEEGTIIEWWSMADFDFKKPISVTYLVDEIALQVDVGRLKEETEAKDAELRVLQQKRRHERRENENGDR